MNTQQFIEIVISIARSLGYSVASNRLGQEQIDFGHKKIHSGHLVKLFPDIMKENANISRLIESVAPGRPCAHRPMRKIIQMIQQRAYVSS